MPETLTPNMILLGIGIISIVFTLVLFTVAGIKEGFKNIW
jgi:hypothetical protein